MPGKLEPASLAWNLMLQGWDLVFLSVAQDAPAPQTTDAAFEGLGGFQSVKVPLWMTALKQLCAFWGWEEADCVLLQRLAGVCVELTRHL